ncbi:hypothetical protein BCV69DRAFT_281683 [Microstroma glucosiphilum]|uniref:SEC7 domain-containing protein n=1 Tax=Pseudomicrostroma glucosiphilum TaxID=1684307 RepID=A0A316UF44_9BASI|nr:hypothetical protein BCV69DRAFT_281683 [Pseudomicrostroma glucosiphilum]PWN21755.1 hypothetical protein BCV69DRAFT_281683 [Pseudomicrostroma glucosiphilum]
MPSPFKAGNGNAAFLPPPSATNPSGRPLTSSSGTNNKSSSPSRRWLFNKPSSSASEANFSDLRKTSSRTSNPRSILSSETDRHSERVAEEPAAVALPSTSFKPTASSTTDGSAPVASSSSGPRVSSVPGGRTLSGRKTGSQIGKSFETLLASNETWVLKSTTAEERTSSPESTTAASSDLSPHSPASPMPGFRLGTSSGHRPWRSPRTEPLLPASSASPLPPSEEEGGLAPPLSTYSLASLTSPREGEAGETSAGPQREEPPQSPSSTRFGTTDAQSQMSSAMPPPSSSKNEGRAPSMGFRPVSRSKLNNGTEASAEQSSAAQEEGALSSSGPSSDPSGVNVQSTPSSFKDRFKKTSGFLKRFTARDSSSSSSSTSDEKKVYSKQSSSGARQSTHSLHQSAIVNDTASHTGSASLPPSPSLGRSRGAPTLDPPPLPVPAIPAKYAEGRPRSLSRSGPGFIGESERHTATKAAIPLAETTSLQGRAAGLAAPINLSSGVRSVSAPGVPVTSMAFEPISSSKPGIGTSSEAASKKGVTPVSVSATELRSTLKAWEREMDDTLKESAQDLEQKTKISEKTSWGPSPTLPKLELGADMDGAPGGADGALSSLLGDEHAQNRINGTSSAPSTPTMPTANLQAPGPSAKNMRPTTSLGGSAVIVEGKPVHRPWERSRSPYLSPGEEGSSQSGATEMNSTLSADGHRLPRLPSRAPLAPEDASKSSPTQIPTGQADHRKPPPISTASDGASLALLPSPPASASRSESTVEPRAAPSLHSNKPRDSVSGASMGTFETADETSEAPTLNVGAEQAANGVDPADVEDDDPIEIPPEETIRLITDTGSGQPTSPEIVEDSTLTITRSCEPQMEAEPSGHQIREASTLAPLPSDLAGHRLGTWTSPSPGSEVQVSRASHNTLPRSSSPSRPRPSTSQNRRNPSSAASPGSEPEAALDDAAQEQAKKLADRCWQEDETWMAKEKIAEWLGGLGTLNEAARDYYFENFDFTNLRVDAALRILCDKLFLRAETQQVDRILAAFSRRYWLCNPASVCGSADSVHAVVFSLLLLNTDLHVADISERMTKSQFVKNTLSALREASSTDQELGMPLSPPKSHNRGAVFDPTLSQHSEMDSDTMSFQSRSFRPEQNDSSSLADSSRPTRRDSISSLTPQHQGGGGGSFSKGTFSRSSPVPGTHSKGDADLEAVLKEMYIAVKSDRIRLPMSEVAPPEHLKSFPGRKGSRPNLGPPSASSNSSNRVTQLKRGSIRGMAGLLGVTSAIKNEDLGSQSSFGSRSVNDSWMTGGSGLGGSQSSGGTSMTSAGSIPQTHAGSLGFANSLLAQNVIKEAREEGRTSDDLQRPASVASTVDELTDNELALIGAPWAKEGVLSRKQYWEAPQKRAKDKNWTETFVVVSKGILSMFKFGESSSSVGAKGGASYGGGNWLSNATSLGEFTLAHTLANSLPPPGYNRARPHVLALTLPSGAVYFFQAGTEDLVQEWVSTCNYWAARTSRPPLAGGVSNMEYGWNKVMPVPDDEEEESYESTEPGEYLADDAASSHGDTSTTTWSTLATPPDGSIYRSLTNRNAAATADNRSIMSGRSGRSMASNVANYTSWQDAVTNGLGGDSVGKARLGSRTPSIASGYTGAGVGNVLSPPSHRSRPPASIRSLSSLNPSGAARSANDRTRINEWKAPVAPSMPSALREEEQMEACLAYISRTEAELTSHNELRQPMLALYNPRGPNYGKALANWQRKSNHLLAELVKWKGYVESLNSALKLRMQKRDERAIETSLTRADEEMAKVQEEEEEGPILV